MGTWADRIKNHPLWQHLETLGPVIDQAFVREGVDASTLDGLHRLKAVLAFVGRRLAGADPNLLIPGPIDSLSSAIQSATLEVQNFISNGNAGHITNANSHADNALAYLASLNVPVITTDFVALREAADAYRTSLEQNMRSLDSLYGQAKNELEGLRSRLSEFATEVAAEKQRLSSVTSEHQSQFSSAQESRNREHAEAQTSRQDKFSAMLLDYNKALGEQNTEFGKQREALLKQHEADLSALSQTYSSKASLLLTEIEKQQSQVEKLVGVIGNLGVTSGYQKAANQARWSGWVWQGIILISLFGMGYVAFFEVLPILKNSFSWEGLATRLVLFLPLLLLVAYGVSQADKYHTVERRTKKLALELEAIGPYLASLPQEKQDEFRLKIGERSFGATEDLIDRRSIKSPSSVLDLVLRDRKIREALVELFRSGKS
jgi:hypothetical protein